jgi:hypothetical protein
MIEDFQKHLAYNTQVKILNKLEGVDNDGNWYAGDQLRALRFYLIDAEIIAEATTGGYSGDVYAIIFCEDRFWLWRDGFGSCAGCDSLDGNNKEMGYEYILATMTSVKEFDTISDLFNYLDHPEDYLYDMDVLKEDLKKDSLKWIKENR